MKKFTLTLMILLGLGFTAMAQGGFFEKGPSAGDYYDNPTNRGGGLALPTEHGSTDDFNGDAPLGTGVFLMMGLGAAYLVAKKTRKE